MLDYIEIFMQIHIKLKYPPKKTATSYSSSYTNCTTVWVLCISAPLIADPLCLPRRCKYMQILLSYQLSIYTIYSEWLINTSLQLKCISLTAEAAYLFVCLTDQQ